MSEGSPSLLKVPPADQPMHSVTLNDLIPTRLQLDLTCTLPSTPISVLTLPLRPSLLVMAMTDPKKAETVYKSIIQGVNGREYASVGILHEQRWWNRSPRANMTKKPS